MLMKAFGDGGLTVDFYAFNGADYVWDPSLGVPAYVVWNPANFVQYRIPNADATRVSAGEYKANAPNTDTTRFEAWIRAGALDTDNMFYEEELYVQTRPEDSEFGEEAVNHDTGPDGDPVVDFLQFTDDADVGIDDADVRAYFKSDYDLGRVTREFIRSQTKTGVVNNGTNTRSGRMINPLYLTVGSTYTIVFNKPGSTITQSVEIHV